MKKFFLTNRVAKIVAIFFLLTGLSQSVFAIGTLIKAPERTDMVYDQTRKIVYITSGSSVLRYDLSTNSFLSPFEFSGKLQGIDISPDSNTLAVANFNLFGIHLVDLKTGKSRKATYQTEYEWGTYTVAFSDNNTLLTSSYPGHLRKYDLSTNTFTALGSDMKSIISASADGKMIGYAQADRSSGPYGRYDVAKNILDQKEGYEEGTDSFNYGIAVNNNGSEYAILNSGGAFLADQELTRFAIIGDWGSQPVAAAYSPIKDILYLPWANTSLIYAYDTKTLQKIASYDVEGAFSLELLKDYPFPNMNCRIKISRDGKYLFVTVRDGIKVIDLSKNDGTKLTEPDSSIQLIAQN